MDIVCEWHRNLRAVLMAEYFDYHKHYILSESSEQLIDMIRTYEIKISEISGVPASYLGR